MEERSSGTGGRTVCWSCGEQLDQADRYCRYCGRGQGERVAWYYKPWGIIALTIFGLGPFSLFLVWRSPRLSPAARAGLAAGIIMATLYAAYRFRQLLALYQSALTGMPY